MTAPTARDLAARILAVRVVKDWLAKEERDLKDSLTAGLMVGERVPGALDPADPDTLLGFVQLTKGRESVTVTDREAFTEWVAEHAPGELVTIPAREDVRSSFVAAVTDAVKKHGGWISPDGELIPVDGVQASKGDPILTVKAAAEADGLVRDALASRRLALEPPA